MPIKSLLLSTPDLRHNPFLQYFGSHYAHVFSPKLSPIDGYPSDAIESQIAALHQKILQDQQKNDGPMKKLAAATEFSGRDIRTPCGVAESAAIESDY